MRSVKTDPWRILKQLYSLRAQRGLTIKRDLFALDLHALPGDDMEPIALIVLLNLAPSRLTRRGVSCGRQDGKGKTACRLTNRHQLHQCFEERRHTFWWQRRLMPTGRTV